MKKNDKRISCFSMAVLSALILAALCGLPGAAQQTPTQPQVLSNAVVNEPIHFDVSSPLAELLTTAPAQQGVRVMHAPRMPKLEQLKGAQQSQVGGQRQPLPSVHRPPHQRHYRPGLPGGREHFLLSAAQMWMLVLPMCLPTPTRPWVTLRSWNG